MAARKKKDYTNLILFTLVAFFAMLALMTAFFWKPNRFYDKAYEPVMKSTGDRGRAATKEENREPRPRGLREDEVKKEYGKRFATY